MSALPLWLDALLAALVLAGAVFALIGAWGLAHLSDFYKRLHGPTKVSTLGVGSVLIASMAYFAWHNDPQWQELLITAFVFLTAPVSAHLLTKAALRTGGEQTPPAPSAGAEGAATIAPDSDSIGAGS